MQMGLTAREYIKRMVDFDNDDMHLNFVQVSKCTNFWVHNSKTGCYFSRPKLPGKFSGDTRTQNFPYKHNESSSNLKIVLKHAKPSDIV